MKTIILILTYLFFANFNAQVHTVMNHQLQIQLAKNQTARLASNETFFKSWEKQKALYDTINARMVAVVAIHDRIYNELSNVNSGIRQGKRLYYVMQDTKMIPSLLNELKKEATKRPQYAVLYTDTLENIVYQTIDIEKEIKDEILGEGRNYLTDSHDRQRLLEKIEGRVNMIIGGIASLTTRLRNVNRKNFLENTPILGNYVFQDKHIVKGILNDINRFIKY